MTAHIAQSSRTILGPLTTTFTAAPSCSIGARACPTCNYAWEAQSCYSTASGNSVVYGISDATQCWPPTSLGLPSPTPPLWGWGFYSPGIICPTGYTSACSATAGSAMTWTPEWSLAAGETAVGCCPSQYVCTNNQPNVNTCQYIASSTSVPVITCESGLSADFTYLQVPMTLNATATPTFTLYAPLIQINWQSSDLPTTSTTISSSAAASTIPSSSFIPTPTASAGLSTVPASTSNSTTSGLSIGAKAGIAVGASLVVIALASLLFLFLRRGKGKYGLAGQHSQTALHELNGSGNGSEGKYGMEYRYAVSEMPHRKEEYRGPPPVEMDAGKMGGYFGPPTAVR